MGDYTEVRTNFVVSDLGVKAVLTEMLLDGSTPEQIIRVAKERGRMNDLFLEHRFTLLFRGGSAYFDTNYRRSTFLDDGRMHVETCANLKHNSEIRLFAKWIRTYCDPQTAPIVTEQFEYHDFTTQYFQDGTICEGPPHPRHG